MLKITVEKTPRGTVVRLEGRLAGPWVNELESTWHAVNMGTGDGHIGIDLTDVTFVGEDGKVLLESMHSLGAKLKAGGCTTRRLVEEIERNLSRAPAK
jgi:anti-anti-sigma regulatory factor